MIKSSLQLKNHVLPSFNSTLELLLFSVPGQPLTQMPSGHEMLVFSPVWLFATPWTRLPGSSGHGTFQARILELVSRFLLQQFFLTQGSNPRLLCLLHWQADSLPLAPRGSLSGRGGGKSWHCHWLVLSPVSTPFPSLSPPPSHLFLHPLPH